MLLLSATAVENVNIFGFERLLHSCLFEFIKQAPNLIFH
jgi:hypothetical protein